MSKKSIKKKKSRRGNIKNPALKVQYNLKSRTDLIDYDYISSLNEEERAYLNSFTEEYINANFKHDGKKIHTKKEHELDSYNRNNSRNRCIFTKSKASGSMVYINELLNSGNKNKGINEEETKIINYIYNEDMDIEDENN